MFRIREALLCVVLSATVSNLAQADWDASAAAQRLGDSGEIHLGLFNGEAADGFMRLGWNRNGDELVLYDRTMMPSGEIYETMEATMSANDLAPKAVAIRFHQGTAILNINANLGDGEMTGVRLVERTGQTVEQKEMAAELPPGTLLRAVTFVLPLVLGTSPGQEIAYPWFGPLGGQVESVTLTSSDGGEIETPAGTFTTTRWALRGGTPENDIYVTRGDNPRIVRIDVVGQPLRFLALPGT